MQNSTIRKLVIWLAKIVLGWLEDYSMKSVMENALKREAEFEANYLALKERLALYEVNIEKLRTEISSVEARRDELHTILDDAESQLEERLRRKEQMLQSMRNREILREKL